MEYRKKIRDMTTQRHGIVHYQRNPGLALFMKQLADAYECRLRDVAAGEAYFKQLYENLYWFEHKKKKLLKQFLF